MTTATQPTINMKHKPEIFLLCKFPNEPRRIRLNIPGIDRGSALSLECETDLGAAEALKLVRRAARILKIKASND